MTFKLRAPFQPMGDQPEAIQGLVNGVRAGKKHQVLLGATGTGKTFTIASVIQELQKPALIMAHNKTLAAQLYAEFKEFFPENAVSYFVSYYDYYQPEAYVPRHDLYIEKDAAIHSRLFPLTKTKRDFALHSSVTKWNALCSLVHLPVKYSMSRMKLRSIPPSNFFQMLKRLKRQWLILRPS